MWVGVAYRTASFAGGRILLAFLLSVGLLAASSSPAAGQGARVAVTVDDLPHTGGDQALGEARRVTAAMTAVLERRGVPAAGFVTGKRVMVDGEIDERLELLREWRRAGTTLENHSFSHASFHRWPEWRYRDDVIRGQLFASRIASEFGDTVRFYRHPFNHAGLTREVRDRFAAFLSRRGLEVAPFTVEHADYIFNSLYVAARAEGDSAVMRRLGDAYLNHLDRAFAFAEDLATETFGRRISHVFLIHANAINAEYLGPMLDRLEARGYRFISLAEAVEDQAYDSRDGYTGSAGVSWLHRWREGLGLDDRLTQEPDPPDWVLEAYRLRTASVPAGR